MTITAIDAQLIGVNRVGECHGLDGHITDVGVLIGEIIPNARRHAHADEKHRDDDHQRQLVRPLWKDV